MSSTPTPWINGKGAGQIAPGATRINLNRQQEYQIGRLLEAAVEPAGNGKVRYKEGFNDDRITKDAQPIAPVTLVHVVRLRKQLFGELKQRPGGGNPMVVLHNRVTELLARVEALEAAITNPNK